MKTNRKIYTPLLLGIACAIGVYMGGKINYSSSDQLFSSNPKKEKLNRLIDYIDYEYVDDVNTDSIVDITVNNILKGLDPHSVYIPEREYDNVSQNMKGDFVGIGVSFYAINDTIMVIQPLEGGPSEKIGIRGGDRILYANDKPLFDLSVSSDSLTTFLKGKRGSKVELKIKRPGHDKLLTFNVERDKVPIKSVEAVYMLNKTVGYIKINRFAESTYEEFRAAIKALEIAGAKEIALDLRDNPGGYLAEAINIIDEFLKEDKLILFTKNKSGSIEKTFAQREGDFENGHVYVLINENSASASEVVAGALQDNDVGTIIGRRSYGKGLVQREMDLGDGSAVRLTIARYYTPTGRSIQKPYENGNANYFRDYERRYENGELKSVDSIKVDDSLKYVTPGGKVVYGGGGIIPDVFIPKDIEIEREHISILLNRGFLSRFIFQELERNRSYYNSLSKKEFDKNVEINDETIDRLIAYGKNEGLSIRLTRYKPLMMQYLKAVMAQQLFGSNYFQRLKNEGDPVIDKVLELSEEKNNFKD
ncbi:S41 family peptidase [Zunongwangia sp. HRR-M8]|uniref:S41 family peptidase n=1 Tax=Zunongwangia sp. HRR-M8 TaxID=3015170 RepID=UPI0022DE0530|nr:S41 family peptidase [Zunongwangia sp. HRR-M8]WBL22146.1 S41 family peptidase [Zunongwangia sp. HRR-M8]